MSLNDLVYFLAGVCAMLFAFGVLIGRLLRRTKKLARDAAILKMRVAALETRMDRHSRLQKAH